MKRPNLRRLLRPAASFLILGGATWLVLDLGGFLRQEPTATDSPAAILPSAAGLPLATASMVEVPELEEAVGAIRAVQEISVAPRILARILTMNVTAAGQRVRKGEVLVELDSQELAAARSEAEAALSAAQDTRDRAEREVARTRELFTQKIASEQDLDRDQTAFQNAQDAVLRAEQVVRSATTMLGYATITAPIDGIVIDKLHEQGDTVAPGEVLLRLHDPTRMQLVASVREGLATRMSVGSQVAVRIDALGLECHGDISEIVPQAAAQSRAFDVKVTGPCPDGVFTGMFGRLLIEAGVRREIRIPGSAVARVGQLDLVQTVTGDGQHLLRRFVVLGERRDDQVVVLAGLNAGDSVVADIAALDARKDSQR